MATYVDFEISRFVGGEVSNPPDGVVVVSVVVGNVELFRTPGLAIGTSVNLPQRFVQLKNKIKLLIFQTIT
jgi:hypothetical protein